MALLARRPGPLNDLAKSLRSQVDGAVFEAFPSDTSPQSLRKAFADIKGHESFKNLKLKVVSWQRRDVQESVLANM